LIGHKALSAGKFLENYNFHSWMRAIDWRVNLFQCVKSTGPGGLDAYVNPTLIRVWRGTRYIDPIIY
jgi:hypothetical protein